MQDLWYSIYTTAKIHASQNDLTFQSFEYTFSFSLITRYGRPKAKDLDHDIMIITNHHHSLKHASDIQADEKKKEMMMMRMIYCDLCVAHSMICNSTFLFVCWNNNTLSPDVLVLGHYIDIYTLGSFC